MNYRVVTFSTLLFAVVLTLATTTSAQPCIRLQQGETYVPGSIRDQYGNPLPTVRICPPSIKMPDFDNPVIHESHQNDVYVNPGNGHILIDKQGHQIKDSALDPYRHIVDQGSLTFVDTHKKDSNGVLWHVTGKRWTSYGKPHSELRRQAVQHVAPGVTIREQGRVTTQAVKTTRITQPSRSTPRDFSIAFPEFD